MWDENLRVYRQHTFENWVHSKETEVMYVAFQMMLDKDNRRPLLLCYGGTGNGKTYLCEALVIAMNGQGENCRLTVWSEFISDLKRRISRRDEYEATYDAIFKGTCECNYLILDDIGMGTRESEWEYGELESIVGYRYRRRLFTVVTTNKDIEELPERIVSRFFDKEVATIIENKGRDYRRRQS